MNPPPAPSKRSGADRHLESEYGSFMETTPTSRYSSSNDAVMTTATAAVTGSNNDNAEDPLTPQSRLALNTTLSTLASSTTTHDYQPSAALASARSYLQSEIQMGKMMSGRANTTPTASSTPQTGFESEKHPLSPHKALLHLMESVEFQKKTEAAKAGTKPGTPSSATMSAGGGFGSGVAGSGASGFGMTFTQHVASSNITEALPNNTSRSFAVRSVSTLGGASTSAQSAYSSRHDSMLAAREKEKERSRCGAEIMYNALIRLRLNNHQCLRISASRSTSSRMSRPTLRIDVGGNGLNGDDDQVFVLLNGIMHSDSRPVHYSDVVALYCVAGTCRGRFLSVDPVKHILTTKKGPVISNHEKWRIINPNVPADAREESRYGDTSRHSFSVDASGRLKESFVSINSTKMQWDQQKVITTSDKVLLKMFSADLFLSVFEDASDPMSASKVVLNKENDGMNDCLQIWELTKSNIPYDPSWNREREYLTGDAFMRTLPKRQDAMDTHDLNLAPLSTFPLPVQERLIMDDLLYVFFGVEGRYIKLDVNENHIDASKAVRTFKFSFENQTGLDPSISQLAARCFVMGEYYLNLTLYVEQFSRYEYGQVNHAFCAALKVIIREYTVIMGQLEYLMNSSTGQGSGPLTLQKMWYYVQPSVATLGMLSKLIDACRNTIGGGSLLTQVQNMQSSLAGDVKAAEMFSFLLERASVPYLKMVERWIYHGELVDPYDEFMIRRDEDIDQDDLHENPYSTYWQDRYTLRESQVPRFLSRFAQKILTAGKYLNVFRTCNRQADCPFAGTIAFAAAREYIFEELIDKAHAFASQTLLDLFVKENDLSNRLASLKHYFLMDQGDFFVDFMDVAEDELNLRADKISLSRLESLLHLSLQTSTCSSDPYKDDLLCFLSPNNLISQMETIYERKQKLPHDSLTNVAASSMSHPGYKVIDAFTLNYSVKWPLTLVISCGALTKYQMIFRHLFFCKHVERRLCDAWLNHQSTKELSLRALLGSSFCLRQRMLHFQQNFVYYMMFEVISPRWHSFQKQLMTVETVDDILDHHREFLDICLKECLLTDPDLLRVLTKLMTVCMLFANSIEIFTRPYTLDEETIKAEREAERDRRAEKKAREEADAALARHRDHTTGNKRKKPGSGLKRRQSSQVDMRRARINELSDHVKLALTDTDANGENAHMRRTRDLENQFDSLLAEFMQQLLHRSLLQPVASTAGEPLTLQPVVALTDDSGNILTTESLGTVSARIGVNPLRYASIQPQGISFAITNGVARCSGLYINMASTGYTIVLESIYHGVRVETAPFDVLVGPIHSLQIVADISTAYGGVAFLPQPAVAVVDKGGNIVTVQNTGTVRIEILHNPTGGHLLPTANYNVTIGGGLAKYQSMYIDVAGSPYSLRYTTDLVLPGGSIVDTNPFTVAAGACSDLVLLASPVGATGGKAFGIQPVVKLVDAGNNTLISDSSSVVHVAIASNPSNGVISPVSMLEMPVRKGIATFRSLKIDKAGNDYSLIYTLYTKNPGVNTYTKTAVTKTSQPFNIAVGSPVTLAFQQNISNGVLDGQPNEQQPVLAILDSGGNVVSSITTGSVTATMVPSAAISSSIIVDTSNAPLLAITSATALANASYPMPYGVGLLLSVAVTFSDEVMASGVPTLTLATAPASGLTGVSECVTLNTWTTTLVFQYDIVLSDGTTQLNYASTAALSLNGGTITDRNGNTPVLTLPSLTSFNSLAGTSTVVIDTTAPVITAVTCASPGNGDYGTGEMISLQVVFSRPVTVYGSPLLPVGLTTVGVTGERVRNAIFTSGNNTNMLVFLYVVQNGDAMVTPTTLLDVTANINVNGGYIKHYSTRPTTDVNVTMVTAPNNLASRQSITIDTSAPVVDASVGVTSTTTNGVYAPGDAIAILVTFTKPVIVREYPRLYLETGSVKRAAGYSSGNATKVLKFIYTVSSYDTHSATGNAHLNYRDDNAIDLNGGSIRRLIQSGSASADAVLSLAAVTLAGKSLKDNAQIDLSGQPATVLALTILSAPSTTVSRGDVITISVSFSSKVTVNTTLGKPSLHLAVGTSDRQAIYTSGSGTQALVFTYDVKLGDLAPGGLDYRTTSSLMLNGGTIRKTSNNSIQDAFLTLPAPSLALASPPVLVDRTYNYSTTIQSLTADVPAGEYGSYQVVTLTVTFSDEVSVDGLPTLHLNTGTQAEFLGGSATSQLSFVYVVKDNDYTTSLDKFDDSALVCVTPCVIINYNSVAVNISMAGISLAPANIIIDTTAPTVVSVYSPTLASQVNSNAFVVGDIIQIIVEMSLEVFIDPPTTDQPLKAPLLILNTTMDGQPVLCVGYANGNRKLLLFSYTVQAGDIQDDLTYVDEDSLTLNSDQCAIKRFSTTPRTDAVLTLPAPVPLGQNNSQVLNVNTTVTPSVVGVTSSKANGLYRCGDTIDIIITFTQNVVVLGSPFLWLDLGTNTPTANYTNGSGGLELTFSYTVQEGDYTMDMEYIDVHSLDTSADTDWILQRSTNPTTIASTDLPYPYTQNSLSFNKNLQINGRKPRVVSAAFVSADGTYGAGAQLVMQISFSSCVVVDTSANTVPLLRFQPSPSETQIITRYATYTSGSPGVSLRFQYTVQAGDTATDLDYADTQSIVQNGARILTCTATGAAPVQSADLHLNPPGGQLLGTTSKAITFGRVTYTDLLVDRLGNEYIVLFRTQVGPLTLEAAATFDVKYSAAYRLRSSPFASGDSLGTSVDVSGDTLVLGAPSAKEPQSAIQIVTATGDSMVYVDEIQIIQTTAKQQPAIQEITSSAAPGETVSGWFYLQSGVVRTRKLYYNFDAAQIQVALELDLGFGIGTTKVTRTENIYCSCYEGYVWSITFLYVEGPLAPLGTIAGALTGRAATVGDGRGADQARVVVESTTITGFYTLQLGTLVSSNIRYNAGEDELASIIEQDLLTPVRRVTRSGPTGLQGYSWSITFVASSALYDVPQLAPQSVGLQGYQAVAIVQTLREGLGRLSGAFRLRFRNDIFPNDETGDIAVNASDLVMMTALNKLTSINSVQVVRSTAMNTYGGYSWTITFVQVNTKNAYGPVVDTSGNLPALVPVTSTIISGKPTVLLQGTKARVVVQVGGYHLAPLAVGDTVWGLPGTNAGMASVFIRDGNVWKQQGGTLTGSDTRAGDFFGTSVAIRDDLLLVGAPGAAVFGDFEQQRLLCTADGGYFRLSYRNKMSSPIAYNANKNTLQLAIVSIMSVSYGYVEITTPFTNLCGGNEITIVLRSGDHGDSNGAIHDLAIDASTLTSGPGAGSGILQEYHAGTFKDDGIVSKGLQCGAAYMFRRNSGTGVWSQEAKLAPPADAYFVNISDYGSHVAIYDTFAVIGAPGAYSEEGRVFVYQFNAVATTWSLFQILTAAPYNIVEGDRFGAAVAISGNPLSTITIAVGAPGYATETGAVFVFDLIDGVFRNQQFMLLETPELQQGDQFGSSLDLDMLTTYTLVVGAPLNQLANGLDSGLALIFTRRSPSDTFFNLQQIVYGSDTRTRDRFGTSVGISRNTIVVGAHESYRGPRTIRKPVQSVTSSCTGGIIQGGTFTLSFKRAVAATNTVVRVVSRALPYNIDADTLEAALESDFPFGNIIVERDGPDTDNGYTWYLTFAAATSAMNLLEVNGTQLIPDNDNADIEIEMAWVVRFPPILRSNAYVFTRNPSGKWTEQMSLFPRKKQYFSWFGSAVAIDQRTAIVGAPNLDTYETGINAGGGFVFDLGILSLGFASKNYSVLEGSSLRMSVQRCGYNSGFCAIDVSRSPKLYVNYGTGDTYSDRRSSNYVPVIPLVGPYQKLSMLETVPLSTGSFFARNVTGQEPFPLVPRGRWLAAAMVGTANGRNQYYGSSQRQSLWIDSDFDYAGESDYASSVGELVFALSTDTILGFTIVTTDDFVVEDPDETIMVRLSLPGVWPTLGGQLWSTVTITDDGDGGSGTRSYLEYLSAGSAGQTGSQYSAAVSVFSDGNVALVGAPLEKQTTTNQNDKVACGAVYFYVRKLGMWEFESKKTPVDCKAGMRYGASVSVDGSLGTVYAIVGAPGMASAFIYRRDGTNWIQDIQLSEPDATSLTQNYGGRKAVNIHGDVAVVGASGLESIYVYHRGMNGWELNTRLYCSDRVVYQIFEQIVQQEYQFGFALDIYRRTIAVGAPFADSGTYAPPQYHDRNFDKNYFGMGAVYIFHLQAQVQQVQLFTDDPIVGGTFCLSVTYRGTLGTTRAISYSSTSADLKSALEEISQLKLVEVSRTGTIDQGFMWMVTFIGAILTVPLLTPTWLGYGCTDCIAFTSSYKANPAKQVSVTNVTPLGTWRQQARLVAPDGNPGDRFGSSVAISGEQVIVGAPNSPALATTTWNFETGDLTGWLTTGTAFDAQPTFGDNSYARINVYSFHAYSREGTGTRSLHEGRYWVGTFENRPGASKQTATITSCSFGNDLLCKQPFYKLPGANAAGTYQGDGPVGTMTSQTFTVLGPWLSFKLGGGCDIRLTYVELLVDGIPSNLKSTGRCMEGMWIVNWDLTSYQNQTAQIRVVDASNSDAWGHINFDDVRFSWDPTQTSTPRAGVAYTFRRKAPGTLEPCVNINRMLCDWEFQARLIASDKRTDDTFGFDVAVDDTTGIAVVGAPGQTAWDANNTEIFNPYDGSPMEGVGSIYVFTRADETRDGKGILLTPPKWSPKEVSKLQYPKKQQQSRFGSSLSLDRYSLLVGAPGFSTTPLLYQVGQIFAYDIAFATVQFTAPLFYCVEGNSDGVVSLAITRSSSNLSLPLTVGYATEDLNAQAVDSLKYKACMLIPVTQRKDCLDYQQVAGEITFAAGETSKQILIPIIDDLCNEVMPEYFVVRLNVPGGEALLGENYITRVRIDDDDFSSDLC